MASDPERAGTLHVSVAFDWGEEVDLARAHSLVGAAVHAFPRRRRTPSSIEFQPRPLHLPLAPVPLDLPGLGRVEAPAEATIFDFAGVSIALQVPFRLSEDCLRQLADYLADPVHVVEAVKRRVEPLYEKLLPAIENASFSPLSEEYFVFQFNPSEPLPSLSAAGTHWLAALVRLESGTLSPEEIAEALRLNIRYTPDDLFIADWPAAVLIDRDCEETLEIVELANLQLLEYRHIDRRLDDNLAVAYSVIHSVTRSRLPLWRTYGKAMRRLGELKVEATELFERTGNVLKLVGDQYLARVYRLLANRFHLERWEESIHRKLVVLESTYQILADQAGHWRTELLEVTVVVLIVLELLLAIVHH